MAVGSGHHHGLRRYPAYKLGIPFAAIPTLSSADGYTPISAPIIIDGQKKSHPHGGADAGGDGPGTS